MNLNRVSGAYYNPTHRQRLLDRLGIKDGYEWTY
jgi:hypothetical protein